MKVGDVVRLKSGSPPMTVCGGGSIQGWDVCHWDSSGFHHLNFQTDALAPSGAPLKVKRMRELISSAKTMTDFQQGIARSLVLTLEKLVSEPEPWE